MTVSELIKTLLPLEHGGLGDITVYVQGDDSFEIEFDSVNDGHGREVVVSMNLSSNELRDIGREINTMD